MCLTLTSLWSWTAPWYVPVNLSSEPVFKHANALVDFGGFGLAFYGLFFFSVRLTNHGDQRCNETHFPNTKVSDLHFVYTLGLETAGHLSTRSQIGQPHNFELNHGWLAIWMNDWLSLRQLFDQTGPHNWWVSSIFISLKYKEVLQACMYATSH